MNEDTVSLLKECNSGCKMATNSMEQVLPYIKDGPLKDIIHGYNKRHVELGDRCHKLLNQGNEKEKDPHPIAKAMSWVTTEIKLTVNDDTKKIAKLLMDGCNMGIQSVSEYKNKYKNASKESREITMELIKEEEAFLDELKEFL